VSLGFVRCAGKFWLTRRKHGSPTRESSRSWAAGSYCRTPGILLGPGARISQTKKTGREKEKKLSETFALLSTLRITSEVALALSSLAQRHSLEPIKTTNFRKAPSSPESVLTARCSSWQGGLFQRQVLAGYLILDLPYLMGRTFNFPWEGETDELQTSYSWANILGATHKWKEDKRISKGPSSVL